MFLFVETVGMFAKYSFRPDFCPLPWILKETISEFMEYNLEKSEE